MPEWWTYALEDFLLFSPRTYYRLFELYNEAVWPAQLVTLLIGVAIAILIHRRTSWSHRAVLALLAVLWLFVAIAFLFDRYATINWAATYFGAAFLLEAALLSWSSVRNRVNLAPDASMAHRGGLLLFFFALGIEPFLAPLFGRTWLQSEIFGLAPDPTAIATLGLFLASARSHWHLLIIPIVWCAISGLTLTAMRSPDATVLIVAGSAALLLAVRKSLSQKERAQTSPS